MAPPLFATLVAIIFAGSMIQGALGFGFGLVAVSTVSLVLPLKAATPLMALLNLPVVLHVAWRLRASVPWKQLTVIIVAMLAGIPLGILVLVQWPQEWLLRTLGLVLIIAAARSGLNLCQGNPRPAAPVSSPGRLHSLLTQSAVGLCTGALAGAFNAGGPPVIAWVYAQPWSKEARTAALQMVFFISLAVRIVIMTISGLYTQEIVLAAAACIPAAVLGSALGQAVFRSVPPRALEVAVTAFLLGIGVKFVVQP